METYVVSPNTQVVLLLCGSLGQVRSTIEVKPLSQSEYYQLANWLKTNGMTPPDLLTPEGVEKLRDMQHAKLDPERLMLLLERGGALAIAVEKWTNNGFWVMSRYDENYPQRLGERLGTAAPLLLYGIGDIESLNDGGLAVVGSRKVDEDGMLFARRIARFAAKQNIQIISGGARGVDCEAMFAALEEGGHVAGVLADGLAKAAVSGTFRDAVREGNLSLVSPYDPGAGFSIGNAMGRNKHIYGLSDWALVVSTSQDTGGTWAGAVENLKNRWVPLFVRSGESAPEGNQALITNGGIAINEDMLDQHTDLRDLFSSCARDSGDISGAAGKDAGQLSLLD